MADDLTEDQLLAHVKEYVIGQPNAIDVHYAAMPDIIVNEKFDREEKKESLKVFIKLLDPNTDLEDIANLPDSIEKIWGSPASGRRKYKILNQDENEILHVRVDTGNIIEK